MVLDGVCERSYAKELSNVYCPLFSFPIVFQVVPDYICAYEHTRRQYFDIIIQREATEDMFSAEAFSRILAQCDEFVPPSIFLQDHRAEVIQSANPNNRYVRLTCEQELPVKELCEAIVASLTYIEPKPELNMNEGLNGFVSIPFAKSDSPACRIVQMTSVGASPATDREDCSSRGSSTMECDETCASANAEAGSSGNVSGSWEDGCMAALLSAMEI